MRGGFRIDWTSHAKTLDSSARSGSRPKEESVADAHLALSFSLRPGLLQRQRQASRQSTPRCVTEDEGGERSSMSRNELKEETLEDEAALASIEPR